MGDNVRVDALLRTAAPHPQTPNPSDEISISILAGFRAVAKHWRIITTASAVALGVAVIYLAFATPQFTATGLIVIDTKSGTALRSSAPTVSDANVDSANIESQVELLKSERILRRVVTSQHLEDDPALRPGPISRFLEAVKRSLMFWSTPTPAAPGEDPKVTAAARELQRLTTAKRIGLTYVVEVSATMPNAAQAAEVANAYAAAFIQDQSNMREELARRMSKLLQSRTEELQSETQKAEIDVEQYKFSGSLTSENSASARVKLRNLESTAQTYRVLHDKFLERYAETWQQQFMSLPDAQVASLAYPPLSKSSPKSALILAASILLGATLGLVLVLIRDRKIVGFPGHP